MAALALLGATVLTGTAHAAASTSGPGVGVNFKGMWGDYSDAQRAAVLDRLAAAHIDHVRLDVGWTMLQPDGPSSYDSWGVAFVDRVIDMANARGIKPTVMLWLTPSWANGGHSDRTPPNNPADYARVAEWAARRYASKVSGWEVWNEPNSSSFWTTEDPAEYARLLRAAYPAFHRGDPAATVVFGGTMYNDTDWIGRAYAAGAHGYFDALATHPYMGVADHAPETADDGSRYTLTHVKAVHDLMARNGDGSKAIWFTEIGWSSHASAPGAENWTRGVSEATQADYEVRTLKLVAAQFPYVKRVFFYTERNQVTGNVQEDNYGLLRRDLTPKPAYTALAAYLGASVPAPAPVVKPAPPARWRHGHTSRVLLAKAVKLRRR